MYPSPRENTEDSPDAYEINEFIATDGGPMNQEALLITNNGIEIETTNFWDSALARRGLFFLSWNAGASRLLVPDSQKHQLDEMLTGRKVTIAFGKREEYPDSDGIEVLFDDGTANPFSLILSIEQSDRRLPKKENGLMSTLLVYIREGHVFTLPITILFTKTIPVDLREARRQ